MNSSKKAFSIIEIIISASILSIWVFWVYKLIWNNMNYIANNENLLQLNMLYNPFRECIKSIWYNSLSWSYNSGDTFSIHFWPDNMWCLTGTYNKTYDFSGVMIDHQEYFLFWKVSEKSSWEMKSELNIYNPLNGYLFNSWSDNQWNQYIIIKK